MILQRHQARSISIDIAKASQPSNERSLIISLGEMASRAGLIKTMSGLFARLMRPVERFFDADLAPMAGNNCSSIGALRKLSRDTGNNWRAAKLRRTFCTAHRREFLVERGDGLTTMTRGTFPVTSTPYFQFKSLGVAVEEDERAAYGQGADS